VANSSKVTKSGSLGSSSKIRDRVARGATRSPNSKSSCYIEQRKSPATGRAFSSEFKYQVLGARTPLWATNTQSARSSISIRGLDPTLLAVNIRLSD